MEKKLTTTPQDHTTPPLRGTPPQEGNAQAKSSLKSPPATGEKVSKFPFAGGVAGAARRGGLVPKLRFPEFRNDDTWEERQFSDVLDEHGLKSAGNEEVFSVSVHKGLINQIEHLGRRFAAASTSHYNRVLPGDIVYTKSPTGDFPLGIIKQSKVSSPVIVSPLYGVFTPETTALGCILDAYFAYPINVSNYLSSIVKKGAKNTINITNKTFLSKSLILPTNKAEQQKIADCLTSLDEVISAEAQKLDTLKAHKKGLMQGLFPDHPAPTGHPSAGGEVSEFPSSGGVAGAARRGGLIPKLRFPEFRDSGEWEEKQIGDLNPFVTSGSRGWAAYYSDAGSLFVRITNLSRESIILDLTDSKFVKLPATASEGVRTQLKMGDLLISITADIGIIGYIDTSIPSPAYINQHIALVRFEAPNVLSKFVAYFLAGENSQRLFRASTDNGTKAGMNLTAIQNLNFLLPSFSEQQRIADCLTSLDELIAAQAEKIEALKTQKKGLMQGLFPQQGSSE